MLIKLWAILQQNIPRVNLLIPFLDISPPEFLLQTVLFVSHKTLAEETPK